MIAPYYQDDYATIYHGDCREILPQLPKVDCTVTSPPYNQIDPDKMKPSGMKNESCGGGGWLTKFDKWGYTDDKPELEYQSWLKAIVGACIEQTNGIVWVNHKTRFRDGYAIHPIRFLDFPLVSEVIWARDGSIALNASRYAPSHEFILGFGRRSYWDDRGNTRFTVWKIASAKGANKKHVCAYPIELVAPLIADSCPEGGIVLDPFMGSGTTLLAAKNLKRRSIGIEIERKYCDLAIDRLRQGILI